MCYLRVVNIQQLHNHVELSHLSCLYGASKQLIIMDHLEHNLSGVNDVPLHG